MSHAVHEYGLGDRLVSKLEVRSFIQVLSCSIYKALGSISNGKHFCDQSYASW